MEDNIIHIHPSSELYYGLALKQFDKMNIKKGIRYFQRGISLAENKNEEVYGRIQLALLYQHDAQFRESIKLIELLLSEVRDAYPDLYYFQAINYMSIGDKEDAKASAEYFLDKADNNTYVSEAEDLLSMLD